MMTFVAQLYDISCWIFT